MHDGNAPSPAAQYGQRGTISAIRGNDDITCITIPAHRWNAFVGPMKGYRLVAINRCQQRSKRNLW